GVNRAVGIESGNMTAWRTEACPAAERDEIADDQNLSIRLYDETADVIRRTGIEAEVERAIDVQPRDSIARDRAAAPAAERVEDAPGEKLAVRLDRKRKHAAVRSRVESIDRGLGVCARDAEQRDETTRRSCHDGNQTTIPDGDRTKDGSQRADPIRLSGTATDRNRTGCE